MKTNDSANACPKCGATVPAEAPQGLCPRCVLAAAAAAEPAPTATSQIPSLERLAVAFPQLQVIELIGRGGMGFVFKARQPHLDRFVALKLLPDSLAHDPQFAERFNREGRVLARLNHPNIVSIFDFGQAGGFYYLMMEYVDGVNLRQAMQAGRFSPAEALTIVPKICEALQFAHEEGILHRDIKPENILLDAKGRVKIADFGIAKLVGEEHPDVSLTATGAALGTMHYMAPEQIEKPSTVDHRADIYSLGVVFYELLTGELPLGRFGPPSAKTPVDSRVDDVVMRTLEKEREKRFQSAGEMGTTVEHLTEVGAGTFKGAPPKGPPVEPQRGPGGTMVINPSAVVSSIPWSRKALWGAALVAGTLPFVFLFVFVLMATNPGNDHVRTQAEAKILVMPAGSFWVNHARILTLLALFGAVGIKGTLLGRSARREIRAQPGKWRGAELALFAVLTYPALILISVAAGLANFIVGLAGITLLPLLGLLPPFVVIGTVMFALWALASTMRRSSGLPLKSSSNDVPEWSHKAVWGAVLVGVSFVPVVILLTFVAYFAANTRNFVVTRSVILIVGSLFFSLPAIAGTILGWMGLSDVSRGEKRGAAFAVFASLFWPVILLAVFTVWLVVAPIRNFAEMAPFASFLLLLVPAGTVTFIIWAIYTTIRKATGQSTLQRHGLLKWVFAALLVTGLAFVFATRFAQTSSRAFTRPVAPAADTDTRPWIEFTITRVELRGEADPSHAKATKYWLNMDYLADVHGAAEQAFLCEASIPGFKAEVHTGEMVSDSKGNPVHDRPLVDFLLPPMTENASQVYDFRTRVKRALEHRTFRLALGEEKVLFEIPNPAGDALKARVRVVPSLKMPVADNTPPWIRFTFTAVELREVQGVRWLAIDYLDDVHGACEKSFPWETTIPGFKAETRTTEFRTDAKDSSPAVRHQRVEYRMPDSSPRDQLERLRDNLEKALVQKSFRLELRENEIPLLLFELPGVEGGSLQARIKVVPPLNQTAGKPSAAAPLAFGPVFERVVTSFQTSPSTGFLDFETGEYRVPPTNVFRELRTQAGQVEVNQGSSRVSSELREWLKESGADLMGGQMINVASLLLFEATPVNHQPPLSFDTIVPSQVTVLGGGAQALVEPGVFPVLMVIPMRLWQEPWKSAKAIPFRTREGNFGVMEVIGLTEKPSGVKIRYKMLQSDRTAAAKPAVREAQAQTMPPSSPLEFRLVADVTNTNTTESVDVMQESQGEGRRPRTHLVLRPVLMDGSAVDRAGIQLETNGMRTIGIELTGAGARQFQFITASNINRQLAIVAGGRVLSAPIIRGVISGGELNLSGGLSAAEVHQLVAELNRKPAGLEFSAVIERSLPRAPEGLAIFLDLDSGVFKTNRTFRLGQRATGDWLLTSGADVRATDAAEQISMIDVFGLASIEAPANAWDSMPPAEVGWNWTLLRAYAKQESKLATTPGRPDTFLFRTWQNGFGILQIMSVTNPSPVVKIRYKLVQDAAAPRAIPASAQNHSFGPVLVRTLAFNESLQDSFLDLDTGRLLTPPKDIAALFKTAYGTRVEWERKPDPRAVKMRAWLQDSGANLMAWGGEYPERLEMREGFAINPPWTGTSHIGFDQADPNAVAKQADIFLKRLLTNSVIKIPLLQPGYDAEAGQRQDTFQFMTREGTIGVLQILNTENNPRGVKIRYKLVQSDKDDAEEIRIRLAREELAASRMQFAAGFLSQYDLAEAERQFAIAEARGDAVAAARANLKFAKESLTATKERVERGILAPLDLKFAESRRALAETDLVDAQLQALRKREQELRGIYTDQHPMLKSIRQRIVEAEQEKARQEKAQ